MMLLVWVFFGLGISPVQDTVSLAPVEVYAPAVDRFAQGQKVISFEKRELQAYASRSIGDLLQEKSPVFVRQYGAGMLASLSFRGTSAGHTAVFWNGLPISSPSLGQSDLSVLPVAAVDQVQLQFGSAGALYGNEAIGGSLHLSSQTDFKKGFKGGFSQAFGSFGLSNSIFSGGFSSQKISLRSRLYRQFSRNDFLYQDLSLPGTPENRQDHAQVEQRGFVQDFAWNLNFSSQIKASVWYHEADREIQPVMGSKTQDQQKDASIRAVVDYFRFGKKSVLNLKTGWVRDQLIFNTSKNETSQFLLASDWDIQATKDWTFKLGARASFIEGDLSTYSATDRRIEGYQSAKWTPNSAVAWSFNLRQVFFSEKIIPFLPSFGLDWQFLEKGNQQFLLKASGGKGFKIPTLNDRFWEPGGNPDLLPEESISAELGIHWTRKGDINLESQVTYYLMQVDNWIIWMPKGSIWSPENIREVRNQGIEWEGKASWKTGAWGWKTGLSYTFSEALDQTTDSQNPRQLPYTPKHQANGTLEVSKSKVALELNSSFVGSRTIGTGESRSMNPFQVWNARLSYSNLSWGKVNFPLSFQILNLFNQDYQVLYLRAMPGRSYQINFTIQI
ncbi:iron complex outermembrane receptor protein [Algoriphagus boseongensis]|uniref:Iron complex outermembrane receptor protein n=1 Tax=Algoriphagus boseongensis TaxID=1442587 RepID=A0A4V3D213_9BACT|nr:TonB-dependent receptor [Algoriphagus boseongensis]TDQ16393.1 iron complex outermembrane receptor protein [Algoriphagus boseongensis]